MSAFGYDIDLPQKLGESGFDLLKAVQKRFLQK
jgi:hypothetical protein